MMDLSTDLGGYYIRGLVKSGFLVKSGRGEYTLTHKGKRQLATSYGHSVFIDRPRLCAMIVAKQGDEYAVMERTRQPFIGAVEWPAGGVLSGESMPAAARRILADRLGIVGEPTPAGTFRRIDLYKDSVFDDKLFVVHTFEIPAGKPTQPGSLTGNNFLYNEKQLQKLGNPSKSLLDILAFVKKGGGMEEFTYQISPDDLYSEH